jgi:methyl-accepting chemotaxis protein
MGFFSGNAHLRELSAKLDALDKSQAVIEFKIDGTVLTANANFLAAMGYTLEEIVGQHHGMFVDPAMRASDDYRQFWARLNRGEFQAAQYKRIAKGGREVWVEASYNPIMDAQNKLYKVIEFATDITKQKIREGEYCGKIEAIGKSQAVIEFEMDGTIITANPNFLGTVGYTLEEVKGHHHSMFVDQAYRNSDEYKQFWARLNRGEFQAAQYKRIGKGGKEIWIEASYNPILDLNGKPYKVVKFATDITQRKAASLAMSAKVNNLVEVISASANEMQTTAELLASAAEETSAQSMAVSTASEQLTGAVSEISRQLSESTRVVNTAVTEAEHSEKMVSSLIEAAEKIGNVSGVVAQIAGQTNLLALNATIEAARAGEAGKGFAVVASEVKSLANQTAKATDEIAQQVAGIQNSSQLTAATIKTITQVINKVSEISTSISGAVEEQSAATREVANNIAGVKQAAEDTGRSSTSLLKISRDMTDRASQLHAEFSEFMKIL